MKTPDEEQLKAIASLSTDSRFIRVKEWLRSVLDIETGALITHSGTGAESLYERRGKCQAVKELLESIDGARKAIETFRKH